MSNSSEQSFPIITGKKTDKGRTRQHNEDSCDLFTATVRSERDPSRRVPAQVAVVADGIGGAEGGEKASKIAVETIEEQIHARASTSPVSKLLEPAIMRANDNINEARRKYPKFENMGTTVVAAIIVDDRLYVSHAGDSRAYLIRQAKIHQLTVDHTWVQEAIEAGRLTVKAGLNHPNKNVVKRFLGTNEPLNVDNQIIDFAGPKAANGLPRLMPHLTLQAGDVIVLCTDGLTDLVTDDEIKQIVKKHPNNPQKTADQLIDRANEKGGIDNITAAVMASPDNSKAALLAPLLQNSKLLIAALAIVLLLLGSWSIFAGSGDENRTAVPETTQTIASEDTGTNEEGADGPGAVAPTTQLAQSPSEPSDDNTGSTGEATSTAIVPVAQSTPLSTFTLAPGETRVPETPSPIPTTAPSSPPTTNNPPAQPPAPNNPTPNNPTTNNPTTNNPPPTATDAPQPSSPPAPSGQPTGASVRPTDIPVRPSNTTAPAADTPVRPTNTPGRPTNTPGRPTDAPAASTTAPRLGTNATQVPATQAPAATQVPATQAPAATQVPARQVPATQVPATQVPATQVPDTQVPATQVPDTQAPATQVPATQVPATQAPATQVPATQVPATQVPATQVPATQVPATQVPATQVPARQVPATQVPPTQVPATQVPPTQVPATQVPPTQVPATQVPPTQVPATQVPPTQPPPPTQVPPTQVPPTQVPPTQVPPTQVPPTQVPPTQPPPTQVPPTQPPPPPPTQPPVQRNVGISLLSPAQNDIQKNNEVQFRVQVNGFENGDRLQLRASIDQNNLFNEGVSFNFDGSAYVANLNYRPGNAGFGKDYYWQVLVIGPDGTTLATSNISQFRWEEPGGGGGEGGSGGDRDG